jgi:hypothetical protein
MAGENSRPHGVTEPFADRLIAANMQRYREAAAWKTAIWVGAGVLFLGALTVAVFVGEKAILGLIGSGFLLASRLILRPEMTRAHQEGVIIQEQYDVESFGLPWNQSLAGSQVSLVDVEDLADRYRGDRAAISDWYVEAGNAPPGAAVLLRQLENVSWGRRDHRRFAALAVAALGISLGATIAVGLSAGVSLAAYVSTLLVPALPWLLDLVDLSVLHWRAAATRGEIEADLNALWTGLGNDGSDVSEDVLRKVQDRILIVRRRFGRVPTWFYRLYRDRNEAAFDAAAARMLKGKGWN